MRTIVFRAMLAALAAAQLILPGIAAAASGIWTSDADGIWSDPVNWSSGIIADGAGSTGDFSTVDITLDRTVHLDSSRTNSVLSFGDADTNTPAGWVIDDNGSGGSNTITLTGSVSINVSPLGEGKSAVISATVTGAAGMTVEGGGVLTLSGNARFSAADWFVLGNSSASNTLNVIDPCKLQRTTTGGNTLQIGAGAATNGNNLLHVSTPGSSADPSLRIQSMQLGISSGSNELRISNGAYVARSLNSGVSPWKMGINAGADNNRIIITGAGSTANMRYNTLRQFLTLGQAGNGNYVRVEDGGTLALYRFETGGDSGTGGGDNNELLVTGAGSTFIGNDSQFIFNVGNSPNATNNRFRVESGATAGVTNSGDARRTFAIGGGSAGDGSNSNYVKIAGSGSVVTMKNYICPLTIGGYVYGIDTGGSSITNIDSNVISNTATGNHLDVGDGGTLVLDATSFYVMGVGSSFNLGDGNALSTATVGASPGIGMIPGLYLKSPDSALYVNNGKLRAGASGTLVSGAGQVQLNGPGYVGTDFTNTIDCAMGGVGSLAKEGTGVLALTATNTYVGETIVSDGVLRLTHTKCLSEKTVVRVSSPGTLDLAFTGMQRIQELIINGVSMGPGIYGAGTSQLTSEDSKGFLYTGMSGGVFILR